MHYDTSLLDFLHNLIFYPQITPIFTDKKIYEKLNNNLSHFEYIKYTRTELCTVNPLRLTSSFTYNLFFLDYFNFFNYSGFVNISFIIIYKIF
jgi:hypothetical protein